MKNRKFLGRNGLFIVGGVFVFVVLSLFILWLVAPMFVSSQLDEVLRKGEESLGRGLGYSKLRVESPYTVSMYDVRVGDPKKLEGAGDSARIGKFSLSLDSSPIWSKDYRVSKVILEDVELDFHQVGGVGNFQDLIERLSRVKVEGEAKDKKVSMLSKLFNPTPRVVLKNVRLVGDAGRLSLLEGMGVSSDVVKEVVIERLDYAGVSEGGGVEGDVVVYFSGESGEEAYRFSVAGYYLKKDEGRLEIVSEGGRFPEYVGDLLGGGVKFSKIVYTMPTHFLLKDLLFEGVEGKILGVEDLDVRLMSMPPRKVSGVYFKNVEARGVEFRLRVSREGEIGWGGKILKGGVVKGHKVAQKEGKEDANNKVWKIRDYIFSQRFYFEGVSVFVEDEREGGFGVFSVRDFQLEFGYRGIRKVISFMIKGSLEGDSSGRFSILGHCNKSGERCDLELDGESLRLASFFDGVVRSLSKKDESQGESEAIFDSIPVVGRILRNSRWDRSVMDFKLKGGYDLNAGYYSLGGDLSLIGYFINDPQWSSVPVGLDVQSHFEAKVDSGAKQLSIELERLKLYSGDFSASFFSEWGKVNPDLKIKEGEVVEDLYFRLKVDAGKQDAQKLYLSIPQGLRPDLDGLEFSGEAGFSLDASGWWSDLSKMGLKFEILLSDDFKVQKWPLNRNLNSLNYGMILDVKDPLASRQHQIVIPPSIYPQYNRDQSLGYSPRMGAVESSLQYPDWVLFEDLNPWLVQLITTTEDGSFFSHSGFSSLQVKAAFSRNVERGGFSRGASTISMQLIKNMYFDRQKTLARKFQESLYTWLMESVFRVAKQRIMSLYFNIIEFGPEIYGIENAAKYYFGKRSVDLSVKESAFLMSIIPRPRTGERYRLMEKLPSGLEKNIDWYIREMFRRKCDKDVLRKSHEKAMRVGKSMVFVPCCPSESEMLRMRVAPLQFYVPDRSNPSLSAYRSDLYSEGGKLLRPGVKKSCGFHEDGRMIYEEIQPSEEEEIIEPEEVEAFTFF